LSITDGSSGSSRGTTWCRAFARSDEQIRREINTDPLVRSYWRRPSDYDVAVENGAVTLSGKVGSKEQAKLIEAFVDRVPGVVGITSRLHWEDGR
jgi:Predicted periplasmic or secreted lipoprotein